jgi:rfaE bifunctional protein kinase chain/domain
MPESPGRGFRYFLPRLFEMPNPVSPTLNPVELAPLVRHFRGRSVTVIGDVMLDVYMKGKVARISPEAPIPVVELDEPDRRVPGGAANVACNIAALGGKAFLVGVIGRDMAGRELTAALKARGVDTSGLVVAPDRPTTEKVRVIAHTQQVVRVDREVKGARFRRRGARDRPKGRNVPRLRTDAVLFEDYNKGVLTADVIRQVMAVAHKKHRCIVTVDPKFQNFFEFKGATVMKPNLKEAVEALGVEGASHSNVDYVGPRIVERLKCKACMITMGEKGIALFEKGKPIRTIPTMAREVYDVSGAGDTVIATLTLALASGVSLLEATVLANYAAGIEVGKLGVATVSSQELIDRLLED